MRPRNGGSGRRGGNVGGGRERGRIGKGQPRGGRPDVVAFPSNWWTWFDVFRGYPLALVIMAMITVVVADGLWIAEAAPPDIAAVATGIAAVISALAAVVEARRGSAMRDKVADHEARLRVLEDRSSRSGS